jgi:hypothetical protein
MKPHLIIKENKGRGHRSGMNKIKKDVLKYSLKKEYYTLPTEVKLLTINFVDPEDQTDPENHMSYFDILNKMGITHLISSRIQMDN